MFLSTTRKSCCVHLKTCHICYLYIISNTVSIISAHSCVVKLPSFQERDDDQEDLIEVEKKEELGEEAI